MKTNIIMNIPMCMFNVEQRTSDGYFEANSLLQQCNKNNTERKMNRYISSSKTEEFINEIKLREAQGQKCTRQNYQPLIKIKGRLAWEYDEENLITLCSECHKKVHNLN